MYYGAFNEVEGVHVELTELVVVTHAACNCFDTVVGQLLGSSLKELWFSSSRIFFTKISAGPYLYTLLSSDLTRDDVPSSRALLP